MVGRPRRGNSAGVRAVFQVRNFRLFFLGQLGSNTGTWFQNLAVSLLVVQLTGSASALALVTVAQFGPILLFAGFAGKLCDRFSPRGVLVVAAALAAATTGGLAVVVSASEIQLGWVYALLAVGGGVHAFERVASQALVFELVGPALLKNAVVLSTMYVSVARSVGPALAGVAFLALGPTICLLINAASYVFSLVSMLLVRPQELHSRRVIEAGTGSLWQTLREVRRSRELLVVLVLNVGVTLTALNMNVVITSAVTLSFDGNAAELGMVNALSAVGAVVGGYLLTRVERISAATLGPACVLFSVTFALNAAAPTLLWFTLAGPLLGAGFGIYQGVLQSAAQVSAPPAMLGRVMSLVTLGGHGITPIGALLMGMIIDMSNAQFALWIAAAATLAAGITVLVLFRGRSSGREVRS